MIRPEDIEIRSARFKTLEKLGWHLVEEEPADSKGEVVYRLGDSSRTYKIITFYPLENNKYGINGFEKINHIIGDIKFDRELLIACSNKIKELESD